MAVARESMRLDYNSDRYECDFAPPGTVICFSVDLLPGSDGWPRAADIPVLGVTLTSDFPCPQGGARLTWPVRPGGDNFIDPWVPDDDTALIPAVPAATLLAYWKTVNSDPVSRMLLTENKPRMWRLARDMAAAMERDAEKATR
jgi:hypothetical protein